MTIEKIFTGDGIVFKCGDDFANAVCIVTLRGENTGKYAIVTIAGLSQAEVWDLKTQVENNPSGYPKQKSLYLAEKFAELVADRLLEELEVLEAVADAANELLNADADVLADVAELEYQDELEAAFVENSHPHFDMLLVYIDGKETKHDSLDLADLAAEAHDAPINKIFAINDKFYFVHKITVWECFMHDDGNWEVWGAKDAPILKTLVLFLGSKPRTAFEITADVEYPQESDYRDGGDGWCASTPEMLDI